MTGDIVAENTNDRNEPTFADKAFAVLFPEPTLKEKLISALPIFMDATGKYGFQVLDRDLEATLDARWQAHIDRLKARYQAQVNEAIAIVQTTEHAFSEMEARAEKAECLLRLDHESIDMLTADCDQAEKALEVVSQRANTMEERWQEARERSNQNCRLFIEQHDDTDTVIAERDKLKAELDDAYDQLSMTNLANDGLVMERDVLLGQKEQWQAQRDEQAAHIAELQQSLSVMTRGRSLAEYELAMAKRTIITLHKQISELEASAS